MAAATVALITELLMRSPSGLNGRPSEYCWAPPAAPSRRHCLGHLATPVPASRIAGDLANMGDLHTVQAARPLPPRPISSASAKADRCRFGKIYAAMVG